MPRRVVQKCLTPLYTGDSTVLYVNGTSRAATGVCAPTVSPLANNGSLIIGEDADDVQSFDGLIDEVRVSNAARSADWIQTEYNNQSSPSTFYSLGVNETSAGSFSLEGMNLEGVTIQ